MEPQTVAGHKIRPRLISIPLEVLLHITSNLTTPEYGNLRCTCKHIEATLFNSFSQEFFSKRQFMFTEFSLQALVDISKSRFSSCLSHVIFGLEQPSMRSFPRTRQIVTNSQSNMRVKNNRLLQEYVDHMSLINAGRDVEMLVEAFSNLGNLETVGMRDFNSRSRNRDYPNTEWKSYGVPTFELDTGSQLETPRRIHAFGAPAVAFLDQANHLSRVFLNLLRALGKACSRPKHFEVILRKNSLHDHAFNLPNYVEPIIQPVLGNLRTLFLDLNSEFPPAQVEIDNVPTGCPSYLLKRFLSRVSQLEHLRLNFQFYSRQEINDVLAWLARPVSVATSNITTGTSLLEPPLPVDFIKLRQLDIGMITIDPQMLLAVIRRYQATLRTISFHKVALVHADSVKPGERVNLWADFFGHLSKLDLNLTALNMSFLCQQQGKKEHMRAITFENSRNTGSKRWAGTDVKSGLRDFTNDMMLHGPDDDSESSHSDESGEDDSDNSMNDVHSDSDDGHDAVADIVL